MAKPAQAGVSVLLRHSPNRHFCRMKSNLLVRPGHGLQITPAAASTLSAKNLRMC